MISLQKEENPFKIAKTLNIDDFKKIARKAAQLEKYREILLAESLKGINHELNDIIFNVSKKSYCIGDQLKSDSDYIFNQRISSAEKDELLVFSTTSQISSDILKLITYNNKNISKVSFFICSPFLSRHQAIKNMFVEYENPQFATPIGQFIEDDQGEINPKIDVIRRSLKIMSSLKNLIKISEKSKIDLELFLFKEAYPGIKIKMISKQCYIQLQPGLFSYANNLYRFGVESDSSDFFKKISATIDSYKNDQSLVEKLQLNSSNYNQFESDVITELCLWLLENGVNPEQIYSNKKKLNSSIDDEKSEYWLELIAYTLNRVISEVKENIENCKKTISDITDCKSDEINSSGNFTGKRSDRFEYHITVAIIFKNEDKYLIIKKSDPKYNKHYSIVAGHLQNHESPLEAIQRDSI